MFLYQPTSGYCYNSDSIFLYDFIGRLNPKGTLLDVGCGVGIISLLLSRDFDIETHIIDKQEIMLDYAKLNFKLNGISVSSNLGDFAIFNPKDRFDYIVSNPPFYDSRVTQSDNTHLNTARYAHHLPFDSFAKNVKRLIKPRGWFLFCYDAKQIDTVMATLKEYNLNPEVVQFVHSKIDRESKLVMIATRANSKSMTRVLPPFVVMDSSNSYLRGALEIFDRARVSSIKGDFDRVG